MGLLILVMVGAILGWFATILTRIENKRETLLNLGTGSVASVLVGALAKSGSVLLGVSGISLIAAAAGAILALACLYFAHTRNQG